MDVNTRQIGLSPKLIGAILAVVVGVVVYLTGEHELGAGLFTAGLGSLGIGAAAAPGAVEVIDDDEEIDFVVGGGPPPESDLE